jgi:hypothetical protein
MLDLEEVCTGWAVTSYQVYKLVNTGRLSTHARPGHQRYYLQAEVEREFGPRSHPPMPAYRSGFESERAA